MAEASYPDDLLYHPEHDWARIDGDIATFGITWFAQDALGEVVFFDPPEVGSSTTAGESYAEVESVKAVSDVIAPAAGEIVEVNTALADAPETINDRPVRRGLAGEGPRCPTRRSRTSAPRPGRVRRTPWNEPLHRRHPRRPARDARDDRRGLDRRALRPPDPRGRPPRPRARPARPGCPSRTSTTTCATWRRRTSRPRTRSRSSAPGCTTRTSRRSSTC